MKEHRLILVLLICAASPQDCGYGHFKWGSECVECGADCSGCTEFWMGDEDCDGCAEGQYLQDGSCQWCGRGVRSCEDPGNLGCFPLYEKKRAADPNTLLCAPVCLIEDCYECGTFSTCRRCVPSYEIDEDGYCVFVEQLDMSAPNITSEEFNQTMLNQTYNQTNQQDMNNTSMQQPNMTDSEQNETQSSEESNATTVEDQEYNNQTMESQEETTMKNETVNEQNITVDKEQQVQNQTVEEQVKNETMENQQQNETTENITQSAVSQEKNITNEKQANNQTEKEQKQTSTENETQEQNGEETPTHQLTEQNTTKLEDSEQSENKSVVQFVNNITEEVRNVSGGVVEQVGNVTESVEEVVGNVSEKVPESFTAVAENVTEVVNSTVKKADEAVEKVDEVVEQGTEQVQGLIESLNDSPIADITPSITDEIPESITDVIPGTSNFFRRLQADPMIECNIGEYISGGKCEKCSQKCLTCYQEASHCIECASGHKRVGWKCLSRKQINMELEFDITKEQFKQNYPELRKDLKNLLPQKLSKLSSPQAITILNATENEGKVTVHGVVDSLTAKDNKNQIAKQIQDNLEKQRKFGGRYDLGSMTLTNYQIDNEQPEQCNCDDNCAEDGYRCCENCWGVGQKLAIIIPIILVILLVICLCVAAGKRGKQKQQEEVREKQRNKTMKYWEVKEGEWKEKEYGQDNKDDMVVISERGMKEGNS